MSAASAWLARLRKLNDCWAKGGAAPHKPLPLVLLGLPAQENGQAEAAFAIRAATVFYSRRYEESSLIGYALTASSAVNIVRSCCIA